MEKNNNEFDFEKHGKDAVAKYSRVQDQYLACAEKVAALIEEALTKKKIKILSIQSRAKEFNSLQRKASQPSKEFPHLPKHSDPLKQITDLAAVRVITYFPNTIIQILEVVKKEFDVFEESDKGEKLDSEEKFGYRSVHLIVSFKNTRTQLVEYETFKEIKVEIQIRTILQHAWAEIEHDIQYKSSIRIETKRRFMALAGLLEIADREFQEIQDKDEKMKKEDAALIESRQLQTVEITADSLKLFLDKKLGPDGRISDFTYDCLTDVLKELGFEFLEQVEKCIENYNADDICIALWGSRQGQSTRFEYVLIASMGDNFLKSDLAKNSTFWADYAKKCLKLMKNSNIYIGNFDPKKYTWNITKI